ncbi:MAG: squalene/phytoene synthase family protein [Rhodospirillaceae bacterium]|jgi:NADH dehydrogenase [ubiquinone] 1 alpha subcomplex assembly factor 6|nr:squalene/phytoene synthase family protein [Rhodospirillaceae bacterium]MBT5243312.1 squalene/phytoene synthase family protein [Rhodospirillaceae bacterium]MBT5563904.1 squalene/phytoene synthase family protein [Rhodospirillaceae bacterium]MBT6240892.1 squalene/phytoene synthase family protein [Rhodospirillaceae bacterium]MBT7137359.1 squalene/phytoene synthase family protein [Rhodospirillaceae bacterium]
MNKDQWLSVCHDMVHRLDRDRLMCAMVAPPGKRDALVALLAFNLEIATIPELVSEPMLGEIRLQWWRETLTRLYDGNSVDHPVALGLAEAIEKADLSKSLFDRYLDARAFDLNGEPPASMMVMEKYVEDTAGVLHTLMAEVLGLAGLAQDLRPQVGEAVAHGGVAWAMTGLLATVDFHAKRGRSYLPADQEDGVKALTQAAERHIGKARSARSRVPKSMLPIMLPVGLAEQNLKQLLSGGARRQGISRLFGFYWKVLSGKY